MKKHVLALFLFSTMLLLLAGCVKPATGNILTGTAITEKAFSVPRNCRIKVAAVEDGRSKVETTKTKQSNIVYMVPLIIWNQSAVAGPEYAEPVSYDADLIPNLQKLMTSIINSSGLCDDRGKTYLLQTKLVHYYGVSYIKASGFSMLLSNNFKKHEFFPTGHVTFQLTLIEEETSMVIDTQYVSESYLFNEFDPDLAVAHAIYLPTPDIIDNKSLVALVALKRLMEKLPYIVDQMLANEQAVQIQDDSNIETFTVLRLTSEYDFQEEMTVEYETGRIIRDVIVRRALPVISKPDEWVVSPLSKSGHWLSDEQYQKLIEKLKEKYNVVYLKNLTAADFYGVR